MNVKAGDGGRGGREDQPVTKSKKVRLQVLNIAAVQMAGYRRLLLRTWYSIDIIRPANNNIVIPAKLLYTLYR